MVSESHAWQIGINTDNKIKAELKTSCTKQRVKPILTDSRLFIIIILVNGVPCYM